MRRITAILSLICCLVPFRSEAVRLGAGILPSEVAADPNSSFVVQDALREKSETGETVYSIDFRPKAGAANQEFVTSLNHSIEMTPENLRLIGATIAEYGDVCDLNALGIKMFLAPIPRLATVEAGRIDNRRIARLYVLDCAEQLPDQYKYRSYDNDDLGIELNGLIVKLTECHDDLVAMHAENPQLFKRFSSAKSSKSK